MFIPLSTDVEAPEMPLALAAQMTEHLTSCQPQMSARQMQQAMFLRGLLEEGEIDFSVFIAKMQRLFPEGMANMPGSLQPYIEHLAQLD